MPRSGPSKEQKLRSRTLAQAVRDNLDPSLLFEFQIRILERKCRVRVEPELDDDGNETGERYIAWDDEGIPPSDELVASAHKWLSDRGWGQAPQSIQLEADFRQHHSYDAGALPVGTLPAQLMFTIRDAIRGALTSGGPSPASTDNSDAVDAEIVASSEHAEGVPASTDHPAPTAIDQHDPCAGAGEQSSSSTDSSKDPSGT